MREGPVPPPCVGQTVLFPHPVGPLIIRGPWIPRHDETVPSRPTGKIGRGHRIDPGQSRSSAPPGASSGASASAADPGAMASGEGSPWRQKV